MANFSERFSELLSRTSRSDRAVADALGVSKQTVSAWKNGDRSPKPPTIATIASCFGVSPAWLAGASDDAQPDALPGNLRRVSDLHTQRVPLIGRVAAGEPIMAEEDYETFVSAPVKCDAALEVQGESMMPTYLPGDIIYIRRQSDVRDGPVAVVLLDDEATLKHVYHDPNGVTLISDNPAYPPMRFTADDYSYMGIYGVPVGYTRMFRSETDALARVTKGFPKG